MDYIYAWGTEMSRRTNNILLKFKKKIYERGPGPHFYFIRFNIDKLIFQYFFFWGKSVSNLISKEINSMNKNQRVLTHPCPSHLASISTILKKCSKKVHLAGRIQSKESKKSQRAYYMVRMQISDRPLWHIQSTQFPHQCQNASILIKY